MHEGNQSFLIVIEKDQNGPINIKVSQRHSEVVKVLQKVRYENAITIISLAVIKAKVCLSNQSRTSI